MNAVAKGYELISSFNFESIPSFADRLDRIKDLCISDVGDMESVGMLLCGLFALFYVGNMVWQSWCKGESINVYALFRPFAIGLIIINFTTFVQVLDEVCGWMNKPAKALVEQAADKKKGYMEKNVRKCFDAMIEDDAQKDTPKEESVKTNVKNEFDTQNDFFLDKSDESSSSLPFVGEIEAAFKLSIMNMILGLLSIVALVIGIGVLSIAFVSKLVLIYVGPFAFAMSLIPYFSNSISNWIGRYITVSLYAPCVNITCFVMMNLFLNVAESIGTKGDIGLCFYMILSLASAASFFAIPSISNYIVTSVGAGGLTGEGRMLASSAARYAGPKVAMAANAIKNIRK